MENLQELIKALIELEKQYSNNYELGSKIRSFINEKLKQE
jgi:hypothetical protein